MTNKEMLEFVISSEIASVEINGETVGEKASAMLKTISKKATKPKAYEKNKELREAVFAFMMESASSSFKASEIAKAFEISSPKASVILKELMETEMVTRQEAGRGKPFVYFVKGKVSASEGVVAKKVVKASSEESVEETEEGAEEA